MYQNHKVDTRAVNEILAFSLIFALVLASITLIYTQAYPALQQQKDIEIDTNVERSLSILHTNFEEVSEGEAPSRETELKVGESQLQMSTEYNMKYSFYRNGNYSNYSISPDVLTYQTPTGNEYYYLNGAIVRNGSAKNDMYFVQEPDDTRVNAGRLQLQLIGLNQKGDYLSGGTHTVQVAGGNGQVYVWTPQSGNTTFTADFIMNTPSQEDRDFWQHHYDEQQSFSSCSTMNATAFSCETAPATEIIVQYRLLTYEYIT